MPVIIRHPAGPRNLSSPELKKPEFVPGEVILNVEEETSMLKLQTLQSLIGAASIEEIPIPSTMRQPGTTRFQGRVFHVRLLPGISTEEGIRRAYERDEVQYAEPNYIVHHHLYSQGEAEAPGTPSRPGPGSAGGSPKAVVPNDLHNKLWGLRNTGQWWGTPGADIHATEAWGITTGTSSGHVVAVVDTGVDYRHSDLAKNVWVNPGEIPGNGKDDDGNGVVDDVHGYNAVDGSGDPMDDQHHGTHVAGTIAAVGNNGIGVVGVNWHARIMAVKFLDKGSGTISDAIKAITYADRMEARVTSNSWGGGGYSQALYDAMKAARPLHVCSAGNASTDTDAWPSYPGSYDLPNIVSVAASDRNDYLADFSNWGKQSVDLAAPGKKVYSTTPGGRYASLSGTSMAAPHVSGAAMLILSKYPTLTNAQIKDRLLNTVDPIPAFQWGTVSGGRLNAAATLADDNVSPSVPKEFGVRAQTALTITLGWMAPGDNGDEGQARRYDLRVADRPIMDGSAGEGDISFEDAKPVAIVAPKSAGSPDTAVVFVPLNRDGNKKTFHFALKAVDKLGNSSGMAVAQGTTHPAVVLFEDDAEGEGKWTAQPPWGKEVVPGRGKVWSDSPGGAYQNNADTALTSIPISLAGVSNPVLFFSERHDLEARFDNVFLEVSADGGQTWKTHLTLTALSDWRTASVNLSEYEGQRIQIRFRLKSDKDTVKDGILLDDIFVAGEPK